MNDIDFLNELDIIKQEIEHYYDYNINNDLLRTLFESKLTMFNCFEFVEIGLSTTAFVLDKTKIGNNYYNKNGALSYKQIELFSKVYSI